MAASTFNSATKSARILRIVAVLGIWWGSYLLLANLIDSYRDFDPSYLGYFFGQVLLRPLLLLLWSSLLWVLAPRIGRILNNGDPED
ncbi:MAG: hypothetical protein JJU20_14585 [Opitutales bacterium]|nr:hypothetical protein [Opitutales bacterium]